MEKFKSFSLNLKGRLCRFSHPQVMGIINATNDSFYARSRYNTCDSIRAIVRTMVDQGATMLDVGAYSSRPGADDVSVYEELRRLEMALSAVRKECTETIISVDTFRAEVARKAVDELGADIINDISGGDIDSDMFQTVAELNVPYVLMHMRGTPATMQLLTDYSDVTTEVIVDLQKKIQRLHDMGVADIIVDPGFGFAKTLEQNYEMLRNLPLFSNLECPLLIGMSRKSMISKATGKPSEECLNGTTAANTIALLGGASILRVHDVAAAADAISIVENTYPDNLNR
ncbi:MAG: dihydropteroate synthase [Muribaculum sp.]|nr:dihydropteroate synthase [Muribaculaceae bacterium]MCM1080582.1 dihydropteroate synthase [Muribaculum sp.]